MKIPLTPSLKWLLWLAAVALFTANALLPASVGVTRLLGVGLFGVIWAGLIVLTWRQPVLRGFLLGLTLAALVFLALPARTHRDTGSLRQGYVVGLRRYQGVPYIWGGESPRGIDCSGLVRRGLIDASFLQGVRTLDPGLTRYSLSLWWHDCSARALGERYRGATEHLFDAPNLNTLDQTRLLPGDFAVTQGGAHTLAYLGGGRWIEADPDKLRVIVVQVPSDNGWFRTPMRLMRWSVFGP